jgi:hypothetical protein
MDTTTTYWKRLYLTNVFAQIRLISPVYEKICVQLQNNTDIPEYWINYHEIYKNITGENVNNNPLYTDIPLYHEKFATMVQKFEELYAAQLWREAEKIDDQAKPYILENILDAYGNEAARDLLKQSLDTETRYYQGLQDMSKEYSTPVNSSSDHWEEGLKEITIQKWITGDNIDQEWSIENPNTKVKRPVNMPPMEVSKTWNILLTPENRSAQQTPTSTQRDLIIIIKINEAYKHNKKIF